MIDYAWEAEGGALKAKVGKIGQEAWIISAYE